MSINVHISELHTTAAGSIENTIKSVDKSAFNLEDEELQNAWKYSLGEKPDDVYLSAQESLQSYPDNDWGKTKVILSAKNTEVVEKTVTSEILIEKKITNNSDSISYFNIISTRKVFDIVKNKWNIEGELGVSQPISYEFRLLDAEMTLSYKQEWNVEGRHTCMKTIGSNIEIPIESGDTIIRLICRKNKIITRIYYDAFLVGKSAANYTDTFQNYSIWTINIQHLMSDSNISNSVKSIEEIEVEYYLEDRIDLLDPETYSVRQSYSLKKYSIPAGNLQSSINIFQKITSPTLRSQRDIDSPQKEIYSINAIQSSSTPYPKQIVKKYSLVNNLNYISVGILGLLGIAGIILLIIYTEFINHI